MTEGRDLLKSVISSKGRERLYGSCGVLAKLPPREPAEGMLKVASCCRNDGSGYATLTFVMDAPADPAIHGELARSLDRITTASLRAHLGAELDTLMRVPLDPLGQQGGFYYDEFNVYFTRLRGREATLIEKSLIRALTGILGWEFGGMARAEGA